MIVFEKGFFFNRRGGHGHSSILKFRLVFKGSPNAGRRPVDGRSSTGRRPVIDRTSKIQKFVSTPMKNQAMTMATPTIEKESFFEYNHVRKINITF